MISPQAYARARENQAKQAMAMLARTAINYVSRGAYGAMRGVDKVKQASDEEPPLI